MLSASPVNGINVGNSTANSSIYTAPSGAMVFAAGSIEWSWGLDNYGNRTTANKGIQQTTANIMYRFSGETPPPPPPPLPTGVYFQDGFESGNMTQWLGPNGTGAATAESSVVNSGSYAVSMTNQTGQYAYLTTQLSAPEALTYTRLYFRVASPGTATVTLAQGRDANNNLLWSLAYDAGRKGINATFWNGARTETQLYSAANIVAPDSWYGLEIESNETTTGHGEVWLNGGSIIHIDGDLSTATPFSTLQLWNDGSGATMYYDDIITSDAYNGPVGGAYPAPGATLSTSAVNFGNQNLGTPSAAQAVTLTNSGSQGLAIASIALGGTNAGDFSQSNSCGSSLAAGAICSISVTFNPTAGGARSATLTLTDNAPGATQTVALTGSGVLPPPPADGIYFQDGFESGNLVNWHAPSGTGTASAESTIVNSGSYAMQLVNGSGQYEGITADLLGGGEALTYTRVYFNVGAGASTTTLAEGRDDAGDIMWVTDYDAGRKGIDAYFWNAARTRYDVYSSTNIVSPNTWYGIEVEVNETATGTAQIWLDGVVIGTVSNDLSTTTPYSHLLLANDSAGTVYYDDVIIHNAYNGPVGGAYPAPGASLSPTALTFASQNTGSTSAAQSVTLTNNGSLTLNIGSIALGGSNPGDFTQTNTCGASLAASATCTVSVTFTPTAAGSRSASLVVTDNAPGGSQSVALSGTGATPPPPPPPPSGLYFQDGFESGNLSAWNAPSGVGSATVQTATVHGGTYALALTDASGQYESVSAGLVGGGETLTYTSFAFNLGSGMTTSTIAQGNDANGNLMWVVVYDSGRQGIDAYFWNGARQRFDLYSNTNLLTANTWYTLEVEFNESTTGTAQIWLNGTSIATATGDMSTASGYSTLSLVNQVTGSVYFDDVKVANVQ